MIDGDGRARVMDFGLSRVESAGPKDRSAVRPGTALAATTALTRTGALLGTPRYMAPEQWLGAVADARSDEFAFCVALWEALYGEAPFAGASQGELARSVGAGALRSPRADARVPGWLAAVLRRGLAREPGARFATMAELLAALRRDPTRRVRRRALLAGVGVLVGGLLLGSGVQRTRHAAVCAAEASGLAEVWSPGLRAGLRERASGSGDAGLVASTARTIERGDAYVAAWSEQRGRSCRSATVEGELDADTYGRVVACLEDGRAGLEVLVGELAVADPRRVQRIGVTLAGLRSPGRCGEPEVLGRYAASAGLATTEAAQLRRAVARTSVLVFVGAFAAAQAELGAAQVQVRRLEVPRLQALVEMAGADLAYQRGDTREARARLIAAHAVAGGGGVDEVAAEAAIFLAEVVGIGGMDPAGGEAWLRLAEMWQTRLGVGPDDDRRFTLVRAHGRLRQARGDLAGATSLFERALAAARRLYGPAHPDVAALLMDLGVIATALGDHAGSYARMEAALGVLVAAHDPEHPQIGDAWFNLGSTRESIGDLGRANALYRRALAIYTRAYGAEDGEVGETWLRIGTVELGRGEYGEAAAAFERARVIAEREPEGEALALALAGLGAAELALHGARPALPLLERALARPEALAGDLSARASARFALARARAELATDDPRAAAAARAALRDLEVLTPPPRGRAAEIEAWLRRRGGATREEVRG